MLPSGSLNIAVSVVPTSGCSGDKVTIPSSSTFSIVMVTVMVSRSPEGSLARILTEYVLLDSKSRLAPSATEICPVATPTSKTLRSTPMRLYSMSSSSLSLAVIASPTAVPEGAFSTIEREVLFPSSKIGGRLAGARLEEPPLPEGGVAVGVGRTVGVPTITLLAPPMVTVLKSESVSTPEKLWLPTVPEAVTV
jgi:hypothetical protein